MKAVIVVAPPAAAWADRAATALARAGLHVARLPDAYAIGVLLATAGFAAVLFDRRSVTCWQHLRARLHAIAPESRLVIIRDDDDTAEDAEGVPAAVPWPEDVDAAMELVRRRP